MTGEPRPMINIDEIPLELEGHGDRFAVQRG